MREAICDQATMSRSDMHRGRFAILLLAFALTASGAPEPSQRWKYEEGWQPRCAEAASHSRRIGGDVKAPIRITRFEPVTGLAKWKVKCTDVFPIFELIVDEKGNVVCARIINFTHTEPPPGLYDYIRANLLRYRFKPATLHGKPVQVLMNYVISYRCN